MTSLRAHLLATLLGGITIIVLTSNAVFYGLVARALRHEYDDSLERKIRGFSVMAEWEHGEVPDPGDLYYEDHGDDADDHIRFEFAEVPMPEFQASPDPEYYEVWDDSGLVLARSPSLQGGNLPRRPVGAGEPAFDDIVLPDARRGRCATIAATPISKSTQGLPGAPPRLVMAVARSTEGLHGTLALLFFGLLTSALLTALVASILIWLAVRRGLAPLDAMRGDIARLGHDTLDWRFPTADKPSELRPIAECLNALLDRLEGAFARERRFTSDVAHELRTPVAELRAVAEVSLKRPGLSDGGRRSLEDALDIARHMERLITSLLSLARCASGQMPAHREETNVDPLARAAWAPLRAEAEAKALHLHWENKARGPLLTDPVLLNTILSNLLANAVAYAPHGGDIKVLMTDEKHHLVIQVSNATDRLTADDLPHLFDIFWRKDRGGDNGAHLGVGLTLVAAFAGVLRATVDRDLLPEGVFRITLRHPRSEASPNF